MRIPWIFTFFLFGYWSSLEARNIRIGKNLEVQSIKEALQIAKCGDSLWISEGLYAEGNLVINQSITIIGEKNSILEGENKYEILTIGADDVSIIGLTFKNSGYSSMNDFASIKMVGANYFVIQNCEIINSYFGIHVSNGTYGTISNCKITGTPDQEQNTGNAIHLWKCDHMEVFNNFCSGHRDGIYFEFVTESHIHDNLSKKNIRYGLHFMFSHKNQYHKNQFLENGAGVAVMYSHHVDMSYNYFKDNWGPASFGILLKDITDSKIMFNHFIKNSAGVFMEGTSRCEIHSNLFSQNGWALRVQASCNDNTIQKNNFVGNTFDLSSNGSLVLNKFEFNYWDRCKSYDLNKDRVGDIPYNPVSLYSILVEQNPAFLVLLRSPLIEILDEMEKAIPVLTPIELQDQSPSLYPHPL